MAEHMTNWVQTAQNINAYICAYTAYPLNCAQNVCGCAHACYAYEQHAPVRHFTLAMNKHGLFPAFGRVYDSKAPALRM